MRGGVKWLFRELRGAKLSEEMSEDGQYLMLLDAERENAMRDPVAGKLMFGRPTRLYLEQQRGSYLQHKVRNAGAHPHHANIDGVQHSWEGVVKGVPARFSYIDFPLGLHADIPQNEQIIDVAGEIDGVQISKEDTLRLIEEFRRIANYQANDVETLRRARRSEELKERQAHLESTEPQKSEDALRRLGLEQK